MKENHQLGFPIRLLAWHMKIKLQRDAIDLGVLQVK
jgi:hypothetical protein